MIDTESQVMPVVLRRVEIKLVPDEEGIDDGDESILSPWSQSSLSPSHSSILLNSLTEHIQDDDGVVDDSRDTEGLDDTSIVVRLCWFCVSFGWA